MTDTTSTAGQASDPRVLCGRALDQVERLASHIGSDHLDGPTPCGQWSVRQLLGHLAAAINRLATTGAGGQPGALPVIVDGVPDAGWIQELATCRARAEAVWTDDSLLERVVVGPLGQEPGRVAIAVYAGEAIMHAWDLAVATDQLGVLDPDLATAALTIAHRALPAETRGGPIPFDPVVPVADGADPYEQLAGWLGRQP